MSPRILPADVYDTLELSALVYRGIGAVYTTTPLTGAPFCAHGHAAFACGVEPKGGFSSRGTPMGDALRAVDIGVITNDDAVCAINKRKNKRWPFHAHRVSFAEWCAELRVIRGDA